MAYTRAWDETFPADTQLANLLGQDIRQFKQDIRERIVSFAAGPIADRPTPEAVFGSANDGVVYFSTDTFLIYRWNGTAWIDITAFILGKLISSGTVIDLSGSVAPTVGQVLTALGANSASWQTPSSPASVRQVHSMFFGMASVGILPFTGDFTILRAPVGGLTITKINGYSTGSNPGNHSYINVRHNGVTDLLLANLALSHAGGWQSVVPDQSSVFAEGDEVQFCVRANDSDVNFVTIQVDIQY